MRLLVLGAAMSGSAAARLGRRCGDEVEVYDRETEPLTALMREGFVVHSGDWNRDLLESVDVVVTSPGIPEHAAPIVDVLDAGIALWSELEFASKRLEAPYAAVTGTNGKTTTTGVAAEMLVASGVAAVAAGNIGTALSDIADRTWDAVVIEASSFQLRFIDQFHPGAAAVLNVAPDHLDWHGSLAAYTSAKARIADNQDESDLLLFDGDDPGAVAAVGSVAHATPISGSRRVQGGGPEGGKLWIGDGAFPLPDLDEAYLLDLVAAASLALHLGASRDGVASVLVDFHPGPHRRASIGTWDGVEWVNDSKATNPHSAIAAIAAYRSVILIAGGRNKDLDLGGLVTAPAVKRVVAIGEAAGDLVAVDPERVSTADSMADAVAAADGLAGPGDTVLLAPGCASFDMFETYAHRGDVFAAEVRRRKDPQ